MKNDDVLWIEIDYHAAWSAVADLVMDAVKRDEAEVAAGTFGSPLWFKMHGAGDQKILQELMDERGIWFRMVKSPGV